MSSSDPLPIYSANASVSNGPPRSLDSCLRRGPKRRPTPSRGVGRQTLVPFPPYTCQHALNRDGTFASPRARYRPQLHPQELLRSGKYIEGGEDSSDLTITNIQHIHSLDVRSAASGSIPERLECMKVSCRDTPYKGAPTTVGRAAYRGLHLVCEVGECPKNTLGKGSHGCPSAGWRLRHSGVIPLDVLRQESDEIIKTPRVPRIHKSLGHICCRRATRRDNCHRFLYGCGPSHKTGPEPLINTCIRS